MSEVGGWSGVEWSGVDGRMENGRSPGSFVDWQPEIPGCHHILGRGWEASAHEYGLARYQIGDPSTGICSQSAMQGHVIPAGQRRSARGKKKDTCHTGLYST